MPWSRLIMLCKLLNQQWKKGRIWSCGFLAVLLGFSSCIKWGKAKLINHSPSFIYEISSSVVYCLGGRAFSKTMGRLYVNKEFYEIMDMTEESEEGLKNGNEFGTKPLCFSSVAMDIQGFILILTTFKTIEVSITLSDSIYLVACIITLRIGNTLFLLLFMASIKTQICWKECPRIINGKTRVEKRTPINNRNFYSYSNHFYFPANAHPHQRLCINTFGSMVECLIR